jgi:WD40 repeat protein
MVVANTDRTL